MNKPTPNTTSKRIIALILLLSQVLSSCLNVNVEPSKRGLTKVEEKHTHASETTTEQTQELPKISSLSLTDEKRLVLVETNPSTVPKISQRSVAPTPSSITIKDEPVTLAGEQPAKLPSSRATQEQARAMKSRLSVIGSKRRELDHIYKKQSSDKRTRQQESASKQAATIPDPSEYESLKELASITFTAKGGHQLKLMMLAGQLIADVKEQPLPGFSRPTLTLPVVVEPGFPISELTKKHSKEWQQAYIEVAFPERAANNGEGYVYVGRRGGMGGMIKQGRQNNSRKKQDGKGGCQFGEDERRPDPDDPSKWVCPGKGKHPRKAPASSSSSSSSVRPSTSSRGNSSSSTRSSTSSYSREEQLAYQKRLEQQRLETGAWFGDVYNRSKAYWESVRHQQAEQQRRKEERRAEIESRIEKMREKKKIIEEEFLKKHESKTDITSIHNLEEAKHFLKKMRKVRREVGKGEADYRSLSCPEIGLHERNPHVRQKPTQKRMNKKSES